MNLFINIYFVLFKEIVFPLQCIYANVYASTLNMLLSLATIFYGINRLKTMTTKRNTLVRKTSKSQMVSYCNRWIQNSQNRISWVFDWNFTNKNRISRFIIIHPWVAKCFTSLKDLIMLLCVNCKTTTIDHHIYKLNQWKILLLYE